MEPNILITNGAIGDAYGLEHALLALGTKVRGLFSPLGKGKAIVHRESAQLCRILFTFAVC